MAETSTINFGWTKPDPGASANTWGSTLNATTDKIDTQVFASQQAGTMIGEVTMFAGPTPPSNWLICDGRSLSQAAPYDKLFAVIGTAFNVAGAAPGSFNLPNLQGVFSLGAGPSNALGSTGGVATVTLDATMIPAHTHTATQPAHGHAATQPAHTHTDAGHIHGITDNQHEHGGIIQPGGQYSLGIAGGTLIGGAGFSGPSGTGITINAGAANIQAAQPAITVPTAQPAITVAANTGGGAAHPNIPPYVAINHIIRYA